MSNDLAEVIIDDLYRIIRQIQQAQLQPYGLQIWRHGREEFRRGYDWNPTGRPNVRVVLEAVDHDR